jgi:hypothetical protein
MSLYNALFGTNAIADVLLASLELARNDVGRFRDCYLQGENEDDLRICVYTRNGGGNREDYQDIFEELSRHPNYIRDYDDDFDCTYATIEFSLPEAFRDDIIAIAKEADADNREPSQKFKDLLDKMHDPDRREDPEVKRALDVSTASRKTKRNE